MEIHAAQKEVRTVFIGGFVGQLVSSVLWGLSAAFTTWHSQRLGIQVLILGGFLIFPAIQLVLRLMHRPHALSAQNPMGQLAMQIAFTLPLSLPLVGAAALVRIAWFYPAFMIVLGAHYLPFAFLYGMRMFFALCGLLVGAGVIIGLYCPAPASLGAWVTAIILLVFAFLGRGLLSQELSRPS